ncbi:hypothetical protein ABZS66_20875 [Dactylosporangium sp. NPDC005572]|uniref:hypothetical protein n=1 Tax=Dactylosporangium sp. NPDC005572 TaxID=3156889 RepID=UPI0033A29261
MYFVLNPTVYAGYCTQVRSTVPIKAKIRVSTDRPAVPVRFEVNGSPYAATTDSAGTYVTEVSIPVPVVAGVHTMTLRATSPSAKSVLATFTQRCT